MNPPNTITRFLAPVVVAVLAIGLAAQREARIKAEAERTALEQQLEILHAVAAENTQLSNLVAHVSMAKPPPGNDSRELLRLRGEVTALRRQTADLASVATENRKAHAEPDHSNHGTNVVDATPTADYWPRNSWAFAGYASPDAAFQSSLWAANNGDVKTVLAGATGQLQQDIEKDLSGKSEDEMSAKAMDEVSGFQSVRILDRAVQPDGTVLLTVSFEGQYDTHTGKLLLQKVGDNWKLAGGL